MVRSLPIIPENLISEDSEVNYSEVLRHNFSDKITENLGTPKDEGSFNNEITIIYHK